MEDECEYGALDVWQLPGKPPYLEKTLSQCHFVRHKSHIEMVKFYKSKIISWPPDLTINFPRKLAKQMRNQFGAQLRPEYDYRLWRKLRTTEQNHEQTKIRGAVACCTRTSASALTMLICCSYSNGNNNIKTRHVCCRMRRPHKNHTTAAQLLGAPRVILESK